MKKYVWLGIAFLSGSAALFAGGIYTAVDKDHISKNQSVVLLTTQVKGTADFLQSQIDREKDFKQLDIARHDSNIATWQAELDDINSALASAATK